MRMPVTEMAGSSSTQMLRPLTQLARAYQWLANREMLACAFILLLTLGLRAALLPWLSVPQPSVHDEFSYLLAGDTYAHGRLTNPPHPFWQHFETFHVLQQPTYASKYQPLQGLVLAFGQKFFGEPWIGVYLSAGLMCAAVCWMLQGWIAPQWALLGALLCVLRVGVLSYFMNSYTAGALPGIGGALAFGAVVRIWRRKQFGHSVTWALGLAILMLSRPYDAAVIAGATAALLLWFVRKSSTPWSTIWGRVGLPAFIVLLICLAGIGYNDYRVTGHALTLPYQVHDRQYAVASMFTMIPLSPEPAYHHSVMRDFWAGWNVDLRTYALAHPVTLTLNKLFFVGDFFFPFWVVLIPVLLFPYDLATAEEVATVWLMVVFVLMIAPLISSQPHYAAAFAGVFYLRSLQSLTRIWSWRRWDKPVGLVLGVLLVGLLGGRLCNTLVDLIRYGEEDSRFTHQRDSFRQSVVEGGTEFSSRRHSVLQMLEQQPGRQLVLVRYRADHSPHREWVYNRADIDASRIVWAREMGPTQDRPFLEYFHDRRVWLLEPDQSPPKLSPYPREVPR